MITTINDIITWCQDSGDFRDQKLPGRHLWRAPCIPLLSGKCCYDWREKKDKSTHYDSENSHDSLIIIHYHLSLFTICTPPLSGK